jgi:hypothetical protein
MTDFESAFREGLEAAKKADFARAEINEVFSRVSATLAKSTEGKLAIGKRKFYVHQNPLVVLAELTRLSPRETYDAIAAWNPSIGDDEPRELAKWSEDRSGYPCVLTWDKQEIQCGDRESLERAIANLLKDPRVGEQLLALLNLKPKPPVAATNPSQENLARHKVSALKLLEDELPIKRLEGRKLVEGILRAEGSLDTEIARRLIAVVLLEAASDEERSDSLNLLTRARFWAPHIAFFNMWIDPKKSVGSKLTGNLTAFFAHPDNPGFQHLIGMIAGIKERIASLEAHRLFGILNVFRLALEWNPLPDSAYVETMRLISRSFQNHPDETVRKIAELIVQKIELSK